LIREKFAVSRVAMFDADAAFNAELDVLFLRMNRALLDK
jgi:hypothetical protein